MSRRPIIEIDEELCNGCGDCITACAEGALQLVDGKARLVGEILCDGFGDCVGKCPTGALKVIDRAAPAYDPAAARARLAASGDHEAVARFDAVAAAHSAGEARAADPAGSPARGGGCPGSQVRLAWSDEPSAPSPGARAPGHAIPSELRQWPVQLHLVRPDMPFFAGREIVVLSTCAPVASADVHWRYLRGRSVVVACPKLDRTEGYVEKLAEILADRSIPRVLVVRMEVPCCGGLTQMVRAALDRCGRPESDLEESVIGLDGDARQPLAMPSPARSGEATPSRPTRMIHQGRG